MTKWWDDPDRRAIATGRMSDAWTDERKAKHSLQMKQRFKDDPKYAKALSDKHKGVPKSDEQKQKMRDAKLGKKKSDTHKANMSRTHVRRNAILNLLKDTGLNHREANTEYMKHKDYYITQYEEDGTLGF